MASKLNQYKIDITEDGSSANDNASPTTYGNNKDGSGSLTAGIELMKPDPSMDVDLHGNPYHNVVMDSPHVSTHVKSRESAGEGPRAELDHRRACMQKVVSITKELTRGECKMGFGVLQAVTKARQDVAIIKCRQLVFNTLCRWKQIDILVTEGHNEAKDNVEYLSALEKFAEPVYNGTPVSIVDTLPALMNWIQMVHTIARYYNTSERMINLFTKMTNQMITNGKDCVLNGDDTDEICKQDLPVRKKNLESCLKLNEESLSSIVRRKRAC